MLIFAGRNRFRSRIPIKTFGRKEKEKAKIPSAAGTKPSSPSSTTEGPKQGGTTPTPGVSPTSQKKSKKDKERAGTATPKSSGRQGKKDSSGVATPSKGGPSSRRPSPKPSNSRQSSPKPPAAHGSRAGSPLAGTPVSAGPATPMTGLEGAGATAPAVKSLIVRFHISPAGRKRLREEEAQPPSSSSVKRIKFNLKSGGKSLSPSPPPEDRRAPQNPPSAEPSRTASPDGYLITEDEIVALIRGERLTVKQLLARLKGKLKRNEDKKAIVGSVLKKRCRIVEGFLVLKD